MTIRLSDERRTRYFAGLALAAALLAGSPTAVAQEEEPEFTGDFRLRDCAFSSLGSNPYFLLQPGHRLVLEGDDDGVTVRVAITVLRRTKDIRVPGVGTVRTRVIEEREWKNGALVEVSRNFFANCTRTSDVFYFGEDVDIYEPDGSVSHGGAWRAGVDGARPGIIMPGTFLLGSRYYQEQAAGVALDRAEHVEAGIEFETEAGDFRKCVRVIETTPLEPGSESEKIYCPGVGLAADNEAELIEVSFRRSDQADD